jgi:hypothetical protein
MNAIYYVRWRASNGEIKQREFSGFRAEADARRFYRKRRANNCPAELGRAYRETLLQRFRAATVRWMGYEIPVPLIAAIVVTVGAAILVLE